MGSFFIAHPFHLVIFSRTGKLLSQVSDQVYENEVLFGDWVPAKFKVLGWDQLLGYASMVPEWLLGPSLGNLGVL